MSQGDRLFRNRAVEARNVMNGRVRVAPPVSWTATSLLLGGLVIAALVFASLATYSRTIEAQGSLETSIASTRLVAPEAGTVSLKVDQGDRIGEGAVVAVTRIDTLSGTSDMMAERRRILESEVQDARYRADAARQAGESRAQAASARARAARMRSDALAAQLDSARRQTAIAREDLERATSIAERGFLSRRDLEIRQAEVDRREQEESRISEEMARARGDALEADAMGAEARSSAIYSARDALESSARAERDLASDASVSETRHVSRVSGTVAALPVRDGQSVGRGDTIAVIVPEGSRMTAMLKVPSSAMTDVREGMEVGISIDAYPYQTFGLVRATITKVSRTVLEDGDTPYYSLEATMPETFLAYGEPVSLLPGMTITGRIRTRERTLLEWMLEPLYAVARR
jgi:membrane fusion protein